MMLNQIDAIKRTAKQKIIDANLPGEIKSCAAWSAQQFLHLAA